MQLLRVVLEPSNDSAFKLVIVSGLCWLTVKRLDLSHSDDDVLHLLQALQVTGTKALVREFLRVVCEWAIAPPQKIVSGQRVALSAGGGCHACAERD